MQQTQQLLTPAGYARSKGLNRSTISRQIKSGLIRLHDGLIDPAEADAARARGLHPIKGNHKETIDSLAVPNGSGIHRSHVPSIIESVAREKAASAALRELQLAREQSQNVNISELRTMLTGAVHRAREHLLLLIDTLPSKIFPEEPAQSSKLIRCREVTKQSVFLALDELSKSWAKFAEELRARREPVERNDQKS